VPPRRRTLSATMSRSWRSGSHLDVNLPGPASFIVFVLTQGRKT
jgi:hypothetical protein